ncbi:MAG: hypothetical protein KGO81_00035 [Bacteroidota bacterium]|nr:hypothetical protein [Bacteroidota bacterium]
MASVLQHKQQLFIWVLAPYVHTTDPNIEYYYDFTQSIAEYTKTFAALQLQWKWQPVTMQDYKEVIAAIVREKNSGKKIPVVLNLCDGDEVNGTPGISVVRMLEEHDLIYCGADEYFYHVTTSKISMKRAFDAAGVPTAKWRAIINPAQRPGRLLEKLGKPVIVKPSVSGGSMGVGIKNVVDTEEALWQQVERMFEGYRGWQLATDGIIAEQFITGPEFTTLIAGSYNQPEKAIIYPPVERVFHPSLPDTEKFLSFDRLWEIYEEETPMPGNANFYEYVTPAEELLEQIKQISWDAYAAVKGKGYTRVDLRMDVQTGKLYVLEVNAQCGLSEDENYTSIGAILRLSGNTFTQLIEHILLDAFERKNLSSAKDLFAA